MDSGSRWVVVVCSRASQRASPRPDGLGCRRRRPFKIGLILPLTGPLHRPAGRSKPRTVYIERGGAVAGRKMS
jgi:hypothetical protein